MSIILKGNNISASSNNDGIGPSEVTNIKASQNASSIILSWTNPSNIIINGSALSTFSYVTIIRNEEHYPMSIKDGKTIYTGNSTSYTDSDVVKDKKYYYRFFVYDTNKLYNDNISMICEASIASIDPILKNNTWEQISSASESGIASSIWNIGDEIDITLSGSFNETITLQIWDFNHFDKSDGTGKAGICFGMKNLMNEYLKMNSSGNNAGGWNACAMRTSVMQYVLNSMSSNLQNVIKEVNTYSNKGDYSTATSVGLLSKDKVFLPGNSEVWSGWSSQYVTESNQKIFPIFSDNNSRIKKMNNGSGDAYDWWLRSASVNNDFCDVLSDGSTDSGYAYSTIGVCFCFNV